MVSKMPGQAIFDRDEKISFNLARLKKGGENFEIVIDADKAVALKEGKKIEISTVLKSENIFHDAKKGELASENLMQELFDTSNPVKVAQHILESGEIQLTAKYRKELRERKEKKIISIINRTCVDPSTHSPHPIARIERAMDEAKAKIDDFRSAEDQVKDVIDTLRPVIPLKSEINKIAVKISAENAAKTYGLIKSSVKLINDEWLKDGTWVGVVELPAGIREDFFNKLNKATKGNVETKILETR
ncbi:MAG: Ribosome maturation protein SDO1 [Candidatus Woesearchaeota archaeon]|nr:Ribosome maturation protein SDO1 [Candidatus Woesearchaeota archaeon]